MSEGIAFGALCAGIGILGGVSVLIAIVSRMVPPRD